MDRSYELAHSITGTPGSRAEGEQQWGNRRGGRVDVPRYGFLMHMMLLSIAIRYSRGERKIVCAKKGGIHC